MMEYIKKNPPYFYFLAFISLTFFFFRESLLYPFFTFDDALNIFSNQYMQKFSWENFFWYWKNSLTPLVYSIWQFFAWPFGNQDPFIFHLINIIGHGINAFLVFLIFQFILEKISSKKDIIKISSFIGAFIFLIHPVQVESVVWISSFRNIISTLFGLLAIYFYLRYSAKKDFLTRYLPLAGLFFILGIMCKPSVVALLIPLVAFHGILSRNKWKKTLLTNTHLFIISGGVVLFHLRSLLNKDLQSIPIVERYKIIVDSFTLYLKNVVWPTELFFNYEKSLINVVNNNTTDVIFNSIIFFAFLVGFVLLIFATKNKIFRSIGLGLFFFLVLVSPNLGIFSYDFQLISTVADRYLYLPLVPLCFSFTALLVYLLERRQKREFFSMASGFVIVSYILLLSFLTDKQIKLWSDNTTILSKTMGENKSYATLMALGTEYFKEKKFSMAENYYLMALKRSPYSYAPISNLLQIYKNVGDKDKVTRFMDKYFSQKNYPPSDAELVGDIYVQLGRFVDAKKAYSLSMTYFPDRGNILQKKINDAKNNTLNALYYHYKELGLYYFHSNNHKLSKRYTKYALELRPQSSELDIITSRFKTHFKKVNF